MKNITPFILLPMLFSCTSENKETGMEETFAPTAGSWSFGDTSYSTDSCNLANNAATSPAIIDALIFTLTNVSETAVTLENATGTQWDCTLDGMALTCNDLSEAEIEQYNDLDGNLVTDEDGNTVNPDATRTIDFTSVATFTDENTATYSATIVANCTGTDCNVIADDWGISELPCTSEYGGTFTFQD